MIAVVFWSFATRFFLNHRNPGPFGKTNRPGYPHPWRVAGRFCSASCTMSPLPMMFFPTRKQLKNVFPLSCLSDSIVSGYYPGNTVVIAMSHPANFCVGHQDLVMLALLSTYQFKKKKKIAPFVSFLYQCCLLCGGSVVARRSPFVFWGRLFLFKPFLLIDLFARCFFPLFGSRRLSSKNCVAGVFH